MTMVEGWSIQLCLFIGVLIYLDYQSTSGSWQALLQQVIVG